MKDNILVLKTNEISDDIWTQIADGYKICFNIKPSPQDLKNSFSKSITGYCLHALKFSSDGSLEGHNYFQPIPYIFNEKPIITALSGGTFVFPQFRKDILIFNKLFKASLEEAKKEGWKIQLGVPNENSYTYSTKLNKCKNIGYLNYYILPVHAAKVLKKNYSFIDKFSSLYANILNKFNLFMSNFYNPKESIRPIHLKNNTEFRKLRLNGKQYKKFIKKNIEGTYNIVNEHGILTAYILDFRENEKRSFKSLSTLVNHIIKEEKVDAILYIGTMNLKQYLLTKVPQKFVPQPLPLCVHMIDSSDKELERVASSIKNIDFGLINFDVR